MHLAQWLAFWCLNRHSQCLILYLFVKTFVYDPLKKIIDSLLYKVSLCSMLSYKVSWCHKWTILPGVVVLSRKEDWPTRNKSKQFWGDALIAVISVLVFEQTLVVFDFLPFCTDFCIWSFEKIIVSLLYKVSLCSMLSYSASWCHKWTILPGVVVLSQREDWLTISKSTLFWEDALGTMISVLAFEQKGFVLNFIPF